MGWRSVLFLFQALAVLCTAAGTSKSSWRAKVRQVDKVTRVTPFPNPTQPLEVEAIEDFSGTIAHSGLNNIVWSLVFAVRFGCLVTKPVYRNSRGVERISRGVVVLPKIGRNLTAFTNAAAQHHFSEVSRAIEGLYRRQLDGATSWGGDEGAF